MATQQSNDTHDTEEPHDMIAEAACRFGSLMEAALLHHLTRTMDTNDTQPLPTPSQLCEELTGFFTSLTKIRQLQDGTFEICLPLMTTDRWRPVILAKPDGKGAFEVFAYNERGGEYFFPKYENWERAFAFHFGADDLESTKDHGYTFFCSRKELPATTLRFGFFLQCLYFSRSKMITEAGAFPKR